MTDLILNENLLSARIYHALKSVVSSGDTLAPRTLEVLICEGFGLTHVGDESYYADGVKDNIQVSIKTRSLKPTVLKKKSGRDFHNCPEKFLGPQHNVKQNRRTYGLEVVQRRQAFDFDDVRAEPAKIGKAAIDGFRENMDQSHRKYGTDISQEIIGVHGYNCTGELYIISLFWKEYEHLDPNVISWKAEGYGVSGYITENDIEYKLVERINGNAKREATCFKEYKNLDKYTHSVKIKLPIPDPWQFDLEQTLAEINLRRKNVPVLFDE